MSFCYEKNCDSALHCAVRATRDAGVCCPDAQDCAANDKAFLVAMLVGYVVTGFLLYGAVCYVMGVPA